MGTPSMAVLDIPNAKVHARRELAGYNPLARLGSMKKHAARWLARVSPGTLQIESKVFPYRGIRAFTGTACRRIK